jgi:hypothetical protein
MSTSTLLQPTAGVEKVEKVWMLPAHREQTYYFVPAAAMSANPYTTTPGVKIASSPIYGPVEHALGFFSGFFNVTVTSPVGPWRAEFAEPLDFAPSGIGFKLLPFDF